MIRTGYLRWEIEGNEQRSAQDRWANEVTLVARPSYRRARILWTPSDNVHQRFAHGTATYADVMAHKVEARWSEITIPDVGPRVYRYSLSDRDKMPNFWMMKLQRFVTAFATEVVSAACQFPQLVLESSILRSNYARMVEHEINRVIDGTSVAMPTRTDEPMLVDVSQRTSHERGIPELVAAELVRDVFTPEEFDEFAHKNYVTIQTSDYIYRIHRRTHALIDVFTADRKPHLKLCVVFQDPGMPPSDEVVMKYLLIKHDPDMLWKVAVRFNTPPRWRDV